MIDGKAIPQWLVGIVVVALVAIVILGGIKSISTVCEKLVPIMAIFYVACCLVIIGLNGEYLGEAIRQILVGAFTPAGAAGGAVGSTVTLALQFGFKRGKFFFSASDPQNSTIKSPDQKPDDFFAYSVGRAGNYNVRAV